MGETSIEWTSQRLGDGRVVPGYTLNGWSGCTKVILPSGKPDPQCSFCYAEREEDKRRGRSKWGRGNPRTLFKGWRNNLRKWNEQAKKEGVYPFVFAHSLSDWADEEVSDAWRDDLFDLAEKNDHLIYLWLTKRVDYAADYWSRRYPNGLPAHFWFGFSAGNREAFELRQRQALHIDARVRFVSIEPYVEPFADLLAPVVKLGRIHWILTGGETGALQQIGPRIAHSDWYRDLRDVSTAARIPFHFKQWGNFAPIAESLADVRGAEAHVSRGGLRASDLNALSAFSVEAMLQTETHHFLGGSTGKHAHGRSLDGREWHEAPKVRS